MNRSERAALIAELLDEMNKRGSWSGATHLQKCVFYLESALKVPLDYDFILYKHGPYSFDLRDDLTEMQVLGVLEVQANPMPYGPSFLSTALSKTLRSKVSSVKDYGKQIEFVAENLGPLGVTALERLSTAQFVNLENPKGSRDQLAKRIHELKPHVPIDLAARAVDQLKKLQETVPA